MLAQRRAFAGALAALLGLAAVLLAACQTAEPVAPAVLASADSDTLEKLKSVLVHAVGRTSVELGPGDATNTSTLSVLPPRPNPALDRNTAQPTLFDIRLRGDTCMLVRRETGQAFDLTGIACRRVGS